MKNRKAQLVKWSNDLKSGETVNGSALPSVVCGFYNQETPYGENRKEGPFETAGRNWNIPKSERLTRSGEIGDGAGRRPCKYQDVLVDGKYRAFIWNVATSFLNDRNYYVFWVNISHFSKDDPWGEGCEKAEKIVAAAFGGVKAPEIDDSDSGATFEFTSEDDMLKAIDALVKAEGDAAVFCKEAA